MITKSDFHGYFDGSVPDSIKEQEQPLTPEEIAFAQKAPRFKTVEVAFRPASHLEFIGKIHSDGTKVLSFEKYSPEAFAFIQERISDGNMFAIFHNGGHDNREVIAINHFAFTARIKDEYL